MSQKDEGMNQKESAGLSLWYELSATKGNLYNQAEALGQRLKTINGSSSRCRSATVIWE